MPKAPHVEIEYCNQCGFVLRSVWLAQELLNTFRDEIGSVTLTPGGGGIFLVTLDQVTVWDRRQEGRFPEAKELKQRVRDRIAPDKDLGHSERT